MAAVTVQFPSLGNMLHLNHAAVGPWPLVTSEAISKFSEENARQGSLNYLEWLKTEQSLRNRIMALINAASTDEIALVKNTSEGLSFIASGLDFRAGDNVVGIKQEFPSNRIVWSSLEQQGVEFRQLDLDACRDDPEAALLALSDERTRLISISAVQYADGLRMNLPLVGEYCKQRNTLFCVDAIQQVGALPFDVQQIHADFAVADGHKWMLGPEGLGFLYVREELIERIKPGQYGWHMVNEVGDYNRDSFTTATTARRFECGSPNMLGIHGLEASLGLLMEVGIEEISQRTLANSNYLLSELERIAGIKILSDSRPERQSGIVTFHSTEMDDQLLHEQLQANGVFCAPRGGGIRFSPHFYTPRKHLETAVQLVSEITKNS